MAAAPPESSSLGARLRSARERTGLTVIQAAERLHVDPHLVEALEGDRFEEFGAAVYARGHIRHYAELVGESPEELQELYATSAHAAHQPDLTRVPKGQDPAGASSALLIPAVLVVGAVAVIGMVWWVAGTLNAARTARRAGAPAEATARAVSPVNPPGLGPGPAGPGAAAGAAVSVARSSAAPPGGPPGAASGSAPSTAAPGGASAAAPGGGPPPRAPAPVRTSALRLHFAEDSWAEVYDARGERLFYDIGSAESTRTVSGVPPLKIVLGNPVGVSLELDGRPVSLPDGAQRNVTLALRITRSGRSAPARLAVAGEQHASAASVQAP